MIRSMKQQFKLQGLIQKYAEKCNSTWITLDETLQYKNTNYQNSMIGIGTGKEPTKHLLDEEMWNAIELTYYYDKQIAFFIFTDNDKFRVYRNKGTGTNGAELVEVVRF